jgi:hypothetical protein
MILRSEGVPEAQLPAILQDTVLKKSRKGKAGQIVLKRLSGVENGNAAQLARKLENKLAPSREDLIEKLEASPTAGKQVKAVARIMLERPDFSLSRAIVEAGADVAQVLDHYAKGALALKKLETVLELYKQMPDLMRDIMRHAIDKETDCELCFGVGEVTSRPKGKSLGKKCPRCGGSGRTWEASKHKEFAVTKVLDMAELTPKAKGPAVQVNQAVQVNAGGAGSEVLAKLSKAADEILYGTSAGTSSSNPYVDAELSEGDPQDA